MTSGIFFILDDDEEEEAENEPELSNDDLIRTVAEKSNVVTFFCEYQFLFMGYNHKYILNGNFAKIQFKFPFIVDDKMDKIATRILSGIQRVETQHFKEKTCYLLT